MFSILISFHALCPHVRHPTDSYEHFIKKKLRPSVTHEGLPQHHQNYSLSMQIQTLNECYSFHCADFNCNNVMIPFDAFDWYSESPREGLNGNYSVKMTNPLDLFDLIFSWDHITLWMELLMDSYLYNSPRLLIGNGCYCHCLKINFEYI